MGASAGGLATFETFFQTVTPDSGAAFVLIQHLDPTRESLTAELVAKHTRMPVVQVERDTPVKADHVYVIPPNKYLTIESGVLCLTAPPVPRGMRMPIDQFLRSLALDQRERAVGIILSGTGTDGALGLKEIKAAGGMTMVQKPETAQYDGMPRSAIATGGVDQVLPVEEMPAVLLRYLRHAYVIQPAPVVPEPAEEREPVEDLGTILAILRARSKLDFGCYKKATLRRRVLRRMSLRHLSRTSDYAAQLRKDADELTALGQDLLINVTNFFRDPPAWQVLDDEVITPLVEGREAGQPLRVWVPGCSTGEEAYSIAMLLIERLQAARKSCPLQIFASDIDDVALDVARAGVYPESIAGDVTPERLRRFFVKEEHTYRVGREVREAVTVAHQNFLTDPPFSRLDLLSCRNLLMYLESAVQEKILMLLHFALVEGGYLFLGSAESVGDHEEMFEPVSKKWRIYRRIGPTRQEKVEFPVASTSRGAAPPAPAAARTTVARVATLAEQVLRERYVPASVVIDRKGEILHFAGPTRNYLAQPPGPPAPDVFAQVLDGLRTQLRAAVQQVIRQGTPVRVISRPVRRGAAFRRVTISVEPFRLSNSSDGLLLVSFEDEGPSPQPEATPTVAPASADESVVRELETELKTTREELRTTIEQLETANEELKASNEEVMSANEELQSTNEELQTSKEELQSLNEELSTINSQLQSKVDELGRTNNDLDNLLASTNLATIFLDRDLHVRRFTPAATQLFTLISSDIGRPLSDVARRFIDPDLSKDARAVLEQLVPVRKEVRTDEGSWYLRETLPYRTRDNRIEGIVITFSDAASEVLQEARLRAEAIVETVHEGLVVLDASLRVVAANPAFCEMFETPPAAVEHKSFFAILGSVWDTAALRTALEDVLPAGRACAEVEITAVLPRIGERVVLARARPLKTGEARPQLMLLVLEDVTERRRQEHALKESDARTRAILQATADAIVTSDMDGVVTHWNAAAARIFGYGADEVLGKNVTMLMPPPYRDEHDSYVRRYVETRVPHIIGQTGREVMGRRKDGTIFPLDLAVSEFEDGKGPGFVGILRDITERKRAEDEERHHLAELARVLRVSLVGELGVGLAHELGQPLAAVANTLEACATNIRAGKVTPKDLLSLVDQAIKESLRAAEIVRNLRELVRGRSPQREDVDLRALIESAVPLVAAQLERYHVRLDLSLGDAPLPIHVSTIEIEQVVLNLLQNAVDSIAEKGGSHGEITVSASRTTDGKTAEVAVRDTGVGVPINLVKNLFEPFFTTKPGGIGMGLAICRSIVEAHGGRLWVAPGEHRPGATTMRFTIPLVSRNARPTRTGTRRGA